MKLLIHIVEGPAILATDAITTTATMGKKISPTQKRSDYPRMSALGRCC